MKKVFVIIFSLSCLVNVYAQRDLQERLSGFVNPDEIVTLSETISFDQAIDVLSKVSKKLTGKTIVSIPSIAEPIGIEIDKIPYKRALTILTQMNGLIYEEGPETIIIKRPLQENEGLDDAIYADVDSREVEISAVFFEANVRDSRERGINWEYLLSQAGLKFGSKLNTFSTTASAEATTGTGDATGGATGGATQLVTPEFTVNNETEFDLGSFTGNATAAFRFFENQNLGEIIARPTVSVRNKQKGRIQIGEDISIKERDFAGNLIDKFYATGTIIDVTPYIYTEDGVDYVLLKLKVERSSGTPGQLSTIIQKTQAETEVLMLNGEETIIGGLFVNVETSERRGIPFLKDLPWWVLGIRYLTGYDTKVIEKREIIILVKTNILPTLKERISIQKDNLIEKMKEANEDALKKYKNVKESEKEE
ncbi:MAG: hypothetical protein JW995_02755 [Melioribacteraceae bacterium]|nr:hypothetical protein [Melioribacteraceae bacterium]